MSGTDGPLGGAGRGGVQIRPLVAADLPACMGLSAASGWNQTADDWRVFLDAAPGRSFAAVQGDQVVGTAATIDYGPAVSWVSMVLVDPGHRRQGIGTLVLQAALEALADRETIRLDATPAGRAVYLGLGFDDERPLARLEAGRWSVPAQAGPPCRPMAAADLEAVIDLDRRVFGSPRPALIRHLFAAAPRLAAVALDGVARPCGFVLGRIGTRFDHVGPLCAADVGVAAALLRCLEPACGGRGTIIDIPRRDPRWDALLTAAGFREQRPFTRMVRGRDACPGEPAESFAIAGPEFG